MSDRSLPTRPRRPSVTLKLALLALVVVAFAAWADSVKYVVTDPADYEYFPPFEPFVNRLATDHLGAEYLCITHALRRGRGFADPFHEETGPTAWMPPALPYLQAGLLWLFDDDLVTLKYAVVGLQVATLVFTGWVVLAAAARAFPGGRGWVVVGLYAALLAQDFNLAFQVTHDTWLILLALDVLLVWYALLPEKPRPMGITAWGAAGGAAALTSPVLGLVWAVLTAVRWPGAWRRWAAAGLVAAVVMAPWVVRNYRAFGRFIPVKSNLFYELYQSQCLTPDGLVRSDVGFNTHPWKAGEERDRYVDQGEMRFLDGKRAVFLADFRARPGDYAVRVWNRLAAATVVYVPFNRRDDDLPPSVWTEFSTVVHPLPLLAVVVLLLSPRPLHRYERAALWVYAAWLLPYVFASYYNRYGFPLVAVKVFLVAAAADRVVSGVRDLFHPPPPPTDPEPTAAG